MGMYPGGFGYGGGGMSPYGMSPYGGLYNYNPVNGNGNAPVAVETAALRSTPLTKYEQVNGELHRDSTSKKGLIIGGLSGAGIGAVAAGAMRGAMGGPVGMAIGAVTGLFLGGIAGDKIGNLTAMQEDVAKDGKLDGGGLAKAESGPNGVLGVF